MKPSRLIFAGAILAALAPFSALRAVDSSAASAPAPAVLQSMPAEAPKTPPEVVDGYLKLGFDRLGSYPFVPPTFDPTVDPKAVPPTGEEQIPAEVKSWNGRKVLVAGFMMPLKMEQGLVTEFLLMKNTLMCCYGTPPNLNELILVKTAHGVHAQMDQPISFYGQLKVGATFDNGYLSGIYQLEDARMGEVVQN
jgi:hypothetical protein